MASWHMIVYRQEDGGAAPAQATSAVGRHLAVWKAEHLQWIDEMEQAGRVVSRGGDGFPYRYTAMAGELLPLIIAGPPGRWKTWEGGEPPDISHQERTWYEGVAKSVATGCRPGEWLLMMAWDES